MPYSVRIEPFGEAGAARTGPATGAVSYEVETEMEAIALATYEVDAGRSRSLRIATVLDGTGMLVLTYAGRAVDGARTLGDDR